MSSPTDPSRGQAAYHWKNLLQQVQSATPAIIRSLPALLWQGLKALPGTILEFHTRLQVEPRLRFLTIAWCFVIIFISICYLASSNPLRLFNPGSVVALPMQDERERLLVYGVEPKSFRIIPVERALLNSGDVQARILRLALTIQKPIGTQERRHESAYISLVDLPDLSIAIRRVWFVKESGLLIVDLRNQTLDAEMDRFLANKKVSKEVRGKYLGSFFEAFTASIFVVDSQIKVVEYRLDGQWMARKNEGFNFAARYLAKP